jgi:hypothetical protein
MSHKTIVIPVFLALIAVIYYFMSPSLRREFPKSDVQLQRVALVNGIEMWGMEMSFRDNMSISPNDEWMVYVGMSYGSLYDDYNIVAYNLKQQQKYILDKKGHYGGQLAYGLNRSCWSLDSKYCYIANDSGVAVDVSGEKPLLIDKKKTDNEQLTCSDCSSLRQEKRFSKKQHGYISLSPDKTHELQFVSYGRGFISHPYLYIVKNGIRRYVDTKVYSINWTSDSQRAYLTKDGDSLYYIDF